MKFLHRPRRLIASLAVFLSPFATGPAWSQAEQGGDDANGGTAGDPVVVPAGDATAGSADALLDRFVAEIQDLSGSFLQQVFDADGEIPDERSTGQFALLRPDRFRWHYLTPYEQIIVADGEWIWKYDVEYEQVDQRPLSDLATSPAMLLSGASAIRDNFRLSELPPEGELRLLELQPLDPAGSEFVSVRIGFVDGVPVVLELVDAFDQLMRVTLDDLERNTGLAAEAFIFVPPAGVTVVGADD